VFLKALGEGVLMNRRFLRAGVLLLWCACAHAYIDTYIAFPFQERISWRTPDKMSLVRGSVFFMTADEARNCDGVPIELPELGGEFDLVRLNTAMQTVGITNPLFLSEWSTLELPYRTEGKQRVTGFDFIVEYALSKHVSLGAACSLMHMHGRCNYCVTSKAQQQVGICSGGRLYPGREFDLERARLNANSLLGICAGEWNETGLSDTELYIRAGSINEYSWKFKQVDLSGQLGIILPTGIKKNIYSPASVAAGGNGHLGFYVRFDGELELTDDTFLGLWLNLTKRLPKTQLQRMPINCEQLAFGVLVDRAWVNPGCTIGISPYVLVDDIQDGFGMYGAYMIAYHFEDQWRYNGTYSPRLCRLGEASKWINEYFTLGLNYDSTKTPRIREYGPRVFFEWTLPTDIFAARRVAKNHRITLGVEFHF